MTATQSQPNSSKSDEDSRAGEGIVRDIFYAWVGHASFLLNWPRQYYDKCVVEGKRCVDEGRRRAKEDTSSESS